MIKLLNVNGVGKALITTTKKNAPVIAIFAGIAGMGVAAYSAYKAGPKALDAIEAEKNRINDERYEEAKKNNYDNFEEMTELPIKDKIRVIWKIVVPTIAIFGGSAALILGGNHIWAKRNAVLAAGYAVLDKAYQEYTTKAVDILGAEKEAEIRKSIVEDHIKENPVPESRQIIATGEGETLCYDSLIGRYFRSDRNTIDRVINALNKRMLTEMYISLNELYSDLNLPAIDLGDSMGWNIDNGMIEPMYDTMLTEGGVPCLTISYLVRPRYDYCL